MRSSPKLVVVRRPILITLWKELSVVSHKVLLLVLNAFLRSLDRPGPPVSGFQKSHAGSWWTKKAALILSVPRRVGHPKRAIISAAFSVRGEAGSPSCKGLSTFYV